MNNPLIYQDRSGNDAGVGVVQAGKDLAASGFKYTGTALIILGYVIVGGALLWDSISIGRPEPGANRSARERAREAGSVNESAIAGNPPMPGLPPVNRELERIAGRYGRVGLCGAAALAMARALRRMGRTPLYAEILFEYRREVFSYTGRFGPTIPISDNGYHVGIMVDGRIHCNVHPQGVQAAVWFNDFWTPGHIWGTEQKWTNIGPVPVLGTINTFGPP